MNTLRYEDNGAVAVLTCPKGHEMQINAEKESHLINKMMDRCPMCEELTPSK